MAQTVQPLRSTEALTMPGIQVIVLNANMCCLQCRDRVSKVLSKMDNLLDYVVDVRQKKVALRGRVDHNKRKRVIRLMSNDKRRKGIEFERLTGEGRSPDLLQKCRWKVKSTYNLIQRAGCFRCASS